VALSRLSNVSFGGLLPERSLLAPSIRAPCAEETRSSGFREHPPCAPDVEDDRLTELAPDGMDQNVDSVALHLLAPTVNAFLKLRAGENATWALRQRVHEGVFARRQDARGVAVAQLVSLCVELEGAGRKGGGRTARAAADESLMRAVSSRNSNGLSR
jgi:hypothetical protein